MTTTDSQRLEVHVLDNDSSTEHRTWCVEHDPTGVCLGGVQQLPGGGAAWIEGAPTPKIIVSLGRSTAKRLPELEPAAARQVASTLQELANQIQPASNN